MDSNNISFDNIDNFFIELILVLMKIGIIREGKTPPDSRVPLTPRQCRRIENNFPIEILVEPSGNRTFEDEEYEKN